jgi:hypothetical protein
LSNKKRKIIYISKLYTGAQHDFSMLKTEFSPTLPWFEAFSLLLDSGFQGIDSLYKTKELKITFKRRRAKKGQTNELTPEQMAHNKQVGSERIFVEHAIGGLKRYRILYNRIRLKGDDTLNRIINTAAGLWNFYIDS